jgi:hypothetical protein
MLYNVNHLIYPFNLLFYCNTSSITWYRRKQTQHSSHPFNFTTIKNIIKHIFLPYLIPLLPSRISHYPWASYTGCSKVNDINWTYISQLKKHFRCSSQLESQLKYKRHFNIFKEIPLKYFGKVRIYWFLN